MKDLFRVALDIQNFLEKKGWKFCFIGGLALQRWGENRLTTDIDLTILSGFGPEEEYIDTLLANFQSRRNDAREFALTYRVLLLQSKENIGIDISLGAMPFEEELIERSLKFEFLPGCALKACSAEDLVVLKAFAARPQDWIDIRGILIKQGSLINRELILNNLEPLAVLKEEPQILTEINKLFEAIPRNKDKDDFR